ncbi:unnamed protein product [Paramecium primaurelia]|uniref:Ubiquitin-like domain-containing protein n=1 Tax=Paramecium primaurelia TaxID=5886 RepID=A0A8S1L510_PARPR|nr:unnamed protein product [Paramecium primaurelia]
MKPQNKQIEIAVENQVVLSDLYISLQNHFNLQNNIEEWICFSYTRNKKLKYEDYLDVHLDQQLIIFTYSSKKLIQNKSNQNQEISLFLNIEYNSRERTIQRVFQNTVTVQDIKELILADHSLLSQNCQVDFKYLGQALNSPSLDTKTIKQMMLRDNATLDLKITRNSEEENKMLAILQNISKQYNQIQQNLQKHFQNIIQKVDAIIRNTLDYISQLLQQIEANICLAQNNLNQLNNPNQIYNIENQLNNINIYVKNIEILSNKYTERIILDQQQILSRYTDKQILLSTPLNTTIRDVINYLKTVNIVINLYNYKEL